MLSKIQFVIAGPKDIPNLHRLVNSAFRGETSRKGWTTEDHLLGGQRIDDDMLFDAMMGLHRRVFLAIENEKLIGCVALELAGAKAKLGMLTVEPGLQGGGAGRFLVRSAENWAQKNWATQLMEMTVIRQRKELISWYMRQNYQLSSETRPFPYGNDRFGLPKQQDLEFVVLVKELNSTRKS